MTKITFNDIEEAAALFGLEPCVVKAVIDVESAGGGFLPDGRVKILFEGHVLYKELQKVGIDPAPLAKSHSSIVYPKWDKSKYKGGAAEHERLNAAALIHKEAALKSASYGLFQIMGFNHKACGYETVQDFVEAQKLDEATQLKSFCAFIKTENHISFLLRKDWSGFARRYNGPRFAENKYDIRLKNAYNDCKKLRG